MNFKRILQLKKSQFSPLHITLGTIVIFFLSTACVFASTSAAEVSNAATLQALVALNEAQATDQASQWEMISYLATKQPNQAVQPEVVPTSTPYRPVLGSVEIAGGRCCAGGVAGRVIELDVAFEAHSLAGEPVTEMRVRLGGIPVEEGDLEVEDWIPFRTQDTLGIEPITNWTTYVLSVQFRDRGGNLSVVYSDEIAIEGTPPITPDP